MEVILGRKGPIASSSLQCVHVCGWLAGVWLGRLFIAVDGCDGICPAAGDQAGLLFGLRWLTKMISNLFITRHGSI